MSSAAITPAALADLVERAKAALPNAYAPYSNFPVGAAVLDDLGRVHIGVNVENVSFGLTNCAERVAIATALASGAKRIRAIGVSALHQHPVSPCGACRQVIREFCDEDVPVVSDGKDGEVVATTVGALLPGAFTRLSN